MFCQKCGTELPENSEFCHKCGAKIVEHQQETDTAESTITENVQCPSSVDTAKAKKDVALHKAAVIGRTFSGGMAILVMLASYLHLHVPLLFNPFIIIGVVSAGLILSALDPKRSIFKKIIELIVGVVLVVVVVYYALSSGGTDDKYIQIVKNGTLDAYPQMTVGEAFDGYLDNPKWESGLSEDKQRFVNVKGGILYAEKEAEIAVQFFVNEKDDTFQYNACEINGLPQTNIVVLGLFENIYGIESTDASNQVDSTNSEETLESSSVTNAPVYGVEESGDTIISNRSVGEIEDYITSYVRPLYSEVNNNLSNYTKSSSNGVTCWHDGKGYIKKMFPSGVNNYDFTREYYYDTDSGRIAFAFVYSGGTEYRLYFRTNQLVRFIPPNGQVINNPDSGEALEMGKYVLSEAY